MRFSRKARCDRKRRIKKTAMISGTFDPPTNGHLYLIEHAARKYEKVRVVIFINKDKTTHFAREQRLRMLKAICERFDNVEADADDGMQYLYAQKHGVSVIVRGYRNERDLEYEKVMADFNERALPTLETELVRCPEKLKGVSSTAVREALASGRPLAPLVPHEILPLIGSPEGK